MGPDIYMFSSYKTYGPHQGIMVVRRQLAELLPNQAHSFNGGSLYKKFTPAGPDHAQVAACAGMVDYFDAVAAHHGGADLSAPERGALVHTLFREAEIARMEPLMEFLRGRNDVRVLGPVEQRCTCAHSRLGHRAQCRRIRRNLGNRRDHGGGW